MSCGSEVGGAGGGGATEEEEKKEAEEEAEEEPGVSEQKQKPHTKMWGKNLCFSSALEHKDLITAQAKRKFSLLSHTPAN